jgi:hypothetical protein
LSNFTTGMSNPNAQTHQSYASSKNSDEMIQYFPQESVALLNLGLINSKLQLQKESVEYYEKCLNNLQMNLSTANSQNYKIKTFKNNVPKIIELYGRVYIGLINNYLVLNDDLRASLYAHSMLDFTLKEYVKLKDEKIKHNSKNGKGNDKNKVQLNIADHENVDSGASLQNSNRLNYLKFLELTACSKLAICYAKQNRLDDALKVCYSQ